MKKMYVVFGLYACLVLTQYVSAAAERVSELPVNRRDENGDTALHRAIVPIYKHSYIPVDAADPSLDIKIGSYPVFNHALIRRLVLAGADPDLPNNAGETVLSTVSKYCVEDTRWHSFYFVQLRETIQKASQRRAAITYKGEVIESLGKILSWPSPLTALVLQYSGLWMDR